VRVIYTLAPRGVTDDCFFRRLPARNPNRAMVVSSAYLSGRVGISPANDPWELLKRLSVRMAMRPVRQTPAPAEESGLGFSFGRRPKGLGTSPQEFIQSPGNVLDSTTTKPHDYKSLAAK